MNVCGFHAKRKVKSLIGQKTNAWYLVMVPYEVGDLSISMKHRRVLFSLNIGKTTTKKQTCKQTNKQTTKQPNKQSNNQTTKQSNKQQHPSSGNSLTRTELLELIFLGGEFRQHVGGLLYSIAFQEHTMIPTKLLDSENAPFVFSRHHNVCEVSGICV